MHDVTRILSRIETGDRQASSELLPLVYEELRKLAAQRMNAERADHTLQATGLVHEAYVRLVDVHQAQDWNSRGHFFAAAAEAMRRILVDHARSKLRKKRNAGFEAIEMTNLADESARQTPEQLLELDDMLKKLEQEDPLVAELVRLRLYAGLTVTEAAKAMSISRTVAYEYWDYALAWYAAEIPA